MRADEVEASWDQTKNSWLFRIRIGEEVIRRHCDAPKDTADATLKELVQKTLQDEGFDSELMEFKVRR